MDELWMPATQGGEAGAPLLAPTVCWFVFSPPALPPTLKPFSEARIGTLHLKLLRIPHRK